MVGPWRLEIYGIIEVGGWDDDALGSQFLSPRGWSRWGRQGGDNSAHSPQANGICSPKNSWMPGFNLTKKRQGRTGVISQHFTGNESKSTNTTNLGPTNSIKTMKAAAANCPPSERQMPCLDDYSNT